MVLGVTSLVPVPLELFTKKFYCAGGLLNLIKITGLTVLGDLNISLGLSDCIGISDCTLQDCPNGNLRLFNLSCLGFFDGNDAMLLVLDF